MYVCSSYIYVGAGGGLGDEEITVQHDLWGWTRKLLLGSSTMGICIICFYVHVSIASLPTAHANWCLCVHSILKLYACPYQDVQCKITCVMWHCTFPETAVWVTVCMTALTVYSSPIHPPGLCTPWLYHMHSQYLRAPPPSCPWHFLLGTMPFTCDHC